METLQAFLDSINNIKDYFTLAIAIVVVLYTAISYIRGIFPVLHRLGKALAKRKIAVFAEGEFETLKNMLVESKLFRESNIIKIDKNSLKKANDLTLFLVHWQPFQNEIDKIIDMKKHNGALIVYAPQKEGLVPDPSRDKINAESNSILVNFKGRLLNDILTCMITTAV